MSVLPHTFSRKQLVLLMLLSVTLVFVYLRPFNSQQHPFIAGDGLGYYSYLPATFIYNDKNYEFAWFNEVHNRYYVHSVFENPEDNLLVKYKDRRINKYYQGLSFLWLPFFGAAHVFALVADFPADGFSAPYQVAIGLSSLLYLLLGLVVLEKLLFSLFRNVFVSILVPCVLFSGTHLFPFAVNVNSLAHVYSFSLVVVFVYLLQRIRANGTVAVSNLLLLLLVLALIIAIRPLDGLIVLAVPAFVSRRNLQFKSGGFNFSAFVFLFLFVALLVYQFRIMWIQTGSLLPYTYTDEKFYFERSRFWEALFSYHMGLFVYVPVFLVAFAGIPFLNKKMRIWLPMLFLVAVFIYASWWFWPITKRGLIDFYVLPAVFLAAALDRFKKTGSKWLAIVLMTVCIAYYQLKHYQMHVGALDEWRNTGEIYWRNFFRLNKAYVFPVHPSSVLADDFCEEDFNTFAKDLHLDSTSAYEGRASLLLDPQNYISKLLTCGYPAYFNRSGEKKIRLSFAIRADDSLSNIHLLLQFKDKNDGKIKEAAFYINEGELRSGQWDYRESGYEVSTEDTLNRAEVSHVDVLAWNVKAKSNIYLDRVKLHYFLTDRSFETDK